jgi:hypothetical protein
VQLALGSAQRQSPPEVELAEEVLLELEPAEPVELALVEAAEEPLALVVAAEEPLELALVEVVPTALPPEPVVPPLPTPATRTVEPHAAANPTTRTSRPVARERIEGILLAVYHVPARAGVLLERSKLRRGTAPLV